MATGTQSQHDSAMFAGALPQVWLVIGDKLGDNAQAEIIAEALGWPWERKQLVFRDRYVIGKPRFRASLHHIDKARSQPLKPPWPELVITVGRRPCMAALWIRKQSGGRTKIVLIGRPRKALDEFALVIASAQFRLPKRPNVLNLSLPLMRIDDSALTAAAEKWRSRLAELPRPLVVLLVGGPTRPFTFDAAVARRLLETASRAAADGTLYVTTSRRTSETVVAALKKDLPPGSRFYQWDADATENPYRGLLAFGDYFIVTGDSVSMMVEVVRLGKALAIFPLPVRRNLATRLYQVFTRLIHPPAGIDEQGGPLKPLGEILYRLGLVSYSRDLTAFHRLLIKRGLAVPIDGPLRAPANRALDELPRVVERIKGIMACHR